MISVGYLTFDFGIQLFSIKDFSGLGLQMIYHHISATVAILSGLAVGYCMPGITAVVLLVEISTIFINIRSLYEKHEYGLFIPQFCQYMFFVTFTFARMIGMPYLIYLFVVGA